MGSPNVEPLADGVDANGEKNGVTADPANALHVALFSALRQEILGFQRDEVTAITTCIAVSGTIISVATWTSVLLLLAIVPFFALMTWRKLLALTVSAFRAGCFIRVFYEPEEPGQAMYWERGQEIMRHHRSRDEEKLSWRKTNRSAITLMLVATAIASVAILGKAAMELLMDSRGRNAGALAFCWAWQGVSLGVVLASTWWCWREMRSHAGAVDWPSTMSETWEAVRAGRERIDADAHAVAMRPARGI